MLLPVSVAHPEPRPPTKEHVMTPTIHLPQPTGYAIPHPTKHTSVGKRAAFAAIGTISAAAVLGAAAAYTGSVAASPVLRACSASSSAIMRDVRSRNRIAAMPPTATAMRSATQENRSSHFSAAIPAK